MIFDRGFNYIKNYLPIEIRVRSSLKFLLPAVEMTIFDMSDNCLPESALRWSSSIIKEQDITIYAPSLFKLYDRPSVKEKKLWFSNLILWLL
mgnify:CR=1 FL=1